MKHKILRTALLLGAIASQLPAHGQERPAPTSAVMCVEGTVKLATIVPTKAQNGATLFIYIRELGRDQGPPTAVKTIKNPMYPQSFRLCGSDQMIPSSTGKSLGGRYQIYARHSLSGVPMKAEGWIGRSAGERDRGVRAGDTVTIVVSRALGTTG